MSKRINCFQKKLDFYLGIVLVKALSLLNYRNKNRKKKLNFYLKQPSLCIGVLRETALGDTVILTGVLQDLRQRYPHARIIVFLGTQNAIMGNHLPGISEYVVLPLLRPIWTLFKLRSYSLDILIDTGQWSRISALLTVLSKAKYTLGFKTKGQYRHYAYHCAIPHRNDIHEIDNFRALTADFHFSKSHSPHLSNIPSLPTHFSDIRKPYIIAHLWGSGSYPHLKEWPIDSWRDIMKWGYLSNFQILLTGSATEKFKNETFSGNHRVWNIAGQFDFGETLAILKNASLCISVNTGIMHVSNAFDVPTISLDGTVNPKRWGGIGKHSVSVGPTQKGCQFLYLGFEYQGQRRDCMEKISVEQVKEAIKKLIATSTIN